MKNLPESKPKRRRSPVWRRTYIKLIHHPEAESPDDCSMFCLECHHQLTDCDLGGTVQRGYSLSSEVSKKVTERDG